MNKPLIALTFPGHLSQAQREHVQAVLAPIAASLGAEPVVLEGGASVALHHDMAPLVAAIEANTKAVTALVDSMSCVTTVEIAGEAIDLGPLLNEAPRAA